MGKLIAVLGSAALMWLGVAGAAVAEQDGSAAAELMAATNEARAEAGLGPLDAAAVVLPVAAGHATRMADDGRIFHNNRLADEVAEWEELGENVGTGGSVAAVHAALMGSPSHRRNILSTRFNEIAIGVERRGERIYVVQVFRRLMPAPAAASTAAAASAPAPAPARAPKPATARTPVPQAAVATPPPAPQVSDAMREPEPMPAAEPVPAPSLATPVDAGAADRAVVTRLRRSASTEDLRLGDGIVVLAACALAFVAVGCVRAATGQGLVPAPA